MPWNSMSPACERNSRVRRGNPDTAGAWLPDRLPMIRPGRSLYSRIILVIAIIFGAGSVVLGTAAWFYARVAADDAYDRLLVGAALQIAESIYVQEGTVSVDPPFSAFETLSLSANDRIFYKVVAPRGVVLTGYDDLTPARSFAETRTPVISDGEYRGFPVRVATVGRLVSDPATPGWAQVVVAQTREARTGLARDLTLKALLLVFAMTSLAFMAVLFAVRRALAPLTRVERELRSRDPKDLTPLDLEIPREIQTLVTTINRFMDRLSGRIALMQRFIADAAHQIRTPLAGLASQVDLLTEESRPERREQQLTRVKERTAELGRLTNQLLNHAMIIHRAEVAEFDTVDLGCPCPSDPDQRRPALAGSRRGHLLQRSAGAGAHARETRSACVKRYRT